MYCKRGREKCKRCRETVQERQRDSAREAVRQRDKVRDTIQRKRERDTV